MWPKSAKNHLTKTRKLSERLPKFGPVIDTKNTPYYGISKFLSNLINPLTEKDYVFQDSFFVAKKIREIPKELFKDGYRFVFFEVESLFASVPLSRTINISDRIYNQKLLTANFREITLKIFLKGCCTKNAFIFNNVIYEQINGISMGSFLGPKLANIIMTELEIKVVDCLWKDGLLKFYLRYIDDTLALIKESDFDNVLSKLSNFHRSLNFKFGKIWWWCW